MNEWIKNLKVGDKVIVSNYYGKDIRTVNKVTPSGLINDTGLNESRCPNCNFVLGYAFEIDAETPDNDCDIPYCYHFTITDKL